MSLIQCPECGKNVSDSADKCPNCGFPIVSEEIEDDEKEIEKWKDDIVYGIASIMISIFATVIAFRINEGGGLVFPLLLYIISVEIGIRHRKIFSFIGMLISGIGIALVIITFIFG